MSNNMNIDQTDQNTIDEGLYSRQLYVLGHEAMKQMSQSNVLIIGCKGLGVEIAKNVCLAGVKSVTLYDPQPTRIEDLSSQYFLTEDDIGVPRAKVTVSKLAELNQYVPVSVVDELSTEYLKNFKCVVVTETSLTKQLEINDFTHKNHIAYIAADSRGLFGSIFCDFGENFICTDTDGNEPLTGMIASITDDGVVTMLEETRHGLENGDFVKFTEVKGMPGLNDGTPRKVEVKGPYTFSIGSVKDLGSAGYNGVFTQVKVPTKISFKSLRESLKDPEYVYPDFGKMMRPPQYHIAFQALSAFADAHEGSLPRPRNDIDAAEFFEFCKKIASTLQFDVELDEKLIKEISYQARGDLVAMSAFLGGAVAQEVLKATTSKFYPLKQYFYFDSLESLPSSVTISEETCKPRGCRYDGQIAVFGSEFQEKIASLSTFLVGAGAIGCEMLKNWAMMGVATGESGHISVTDMDSIEKSNLNRQFLFRPRDVGKLKSECASTAVSIMNPSLTGKITSYQERVGPESEGIFGDEFFEKLSLVTNALDNVEARMYVDRRCVFFEKPLLESGTLGTKGNTQVVVPHLTESYGSSQDPPEKSFPICTLKNFPNRIEHTIAWARDLFEGLFKQPIDNVNMYLSSPNFLETSLKTSSNPREVLENIRDYLVTEKPLSFEECIMWARLQFDKFFNNNIQQLLFNFPKDSVTSTGQPFWSGPKRAPTPLSFDIHNREHFDFIVAAASLYAFNYGLKSETDPAIYERVLAGYNPPPFAPKSGIKIQVNENEEAPETAANKDKQELKSIADSLPPPSSLVGFRLTPAEFEKDDDSNHHIDFITAASNLRAMNYDITPADRFKTKFVAGKIVPAMCTSTAVVSGLVCLELVKLVDGKKKIEEYKNGFFNLAIGLFTFSDPIASPKMKVNGKEIDKIWDRYNLPDCTLQELIDYFQKEEGLEVTMLSSGVSLLYANFQPPKKLAERLPLKISELVEQITKKKLEPFRKHLVLEICCDDANGEDVEVPFICIKL
ncbi:ubiquitin activating enzyme E1 Uba1 [Schizosaccharomyces pombe]|uniref:Ubiquitin-activating enzyme E1 1 n=1 Tax=Schizosaccharomyces pombe (strain 972 / ATCC 24843) TaxID=284812 RepID=UBA1_SCHPO|nr:ubiquitin-activating enzyme E1 [Schizosaccharomyces pombe]O94609.1 RecName: Full=Ubiquitin-activating enzyme E1 1; AltName: Full=Poly(A)+ RNA transport protein 3 [Schizosaccharomyces pombe 972h-]BAA75198.1 poly(A)+ RNA transport protein Ptr3p [Schizosaccharomyces pombe]CAA22354.2 ubiquitin activating enzyme E1 [Schizosaccharomyces pombe]|eukprot:NP_001342779.1 ubiquitin-activating enzyme E1 [Schizosaccharomyces pombe]